MNLAHILDAHPDSSTALVSRGRSTTYGTLRQQIASMRGALLRENVGKGDVVAGRTPLPYFAGRMETADVAPSACPA